MRRTHEINALKIKNWARATCALVRMLCMKEKRTGCCNHLSYISVRFQSGVPRTRTKHDRKSFCYKWFRFDLKRCSCFECVSKKKTTKYLFLYTYFLVNKVPGNSTDECTAQEKKQNEMKKRQREQEDSVSCHEKEGKSKSFSLKNYNVRIPFHTDNELRLS